MRHLAKDYLWFWMVLLQRFVQHRGISSAAALTYTSLFAVVPLLTVTFAVISAIPFFHDMGGQIQTFIFSNFVPATGVAVQEYLLGFSLQARQLTWVGVVGLAVTAFMMLLNIENAFTSIWLVRQPRRGVAGFLLYWAILSLGPMLLGAGFAVTTYIASLELISGPHSLPGASTFLSLLPLLCSVAAFTLIYASVPNARVPFKHALIGGLFTATLFEAAKQLFAVYVGLFPSYQLIYGAFAAVPLFLLWIYLSWLIVLFGAELVCSLSFPRHSQLRRLPRVLALLGVLRVLLERQQQGQGISIAGLEAAGWPLADDEWLDLIGFLAGEKLICPIGGDQWMLSRDLNHYSLTSLLQRSPWPLPVPQSLPETLAEPWYPAVRAALTLLHEDQAALFAGGLAQWLQPEAEAAAA